jgi:hypothetical protein
MVRLEHFHLINFPPYASDRDPQEHIWKDAKEKTANTDTESFSGMIALFTNTALGRRYDYKI